MKKIKNIFFDLDNTLWDFDKNSDLTFHKIIEKNNIKIDVSKFLKKYKDTLDSADECIICYSEKNMRIKRLKPIDSKLISESFNHKNLVVVDDHEKFENKVLSFDLSNTVLLMMSSGKFGGFNFDKLKNL